ncbi:ferredoxin (plasmid) [Streptomyces sp. BI20]|uniref:ferredoxin n=1 Tax=Streptomyces sp. BI20 TaxID=3403460 RepID=UPI003C7385E7
MSADPGGTRTLRVTADRELCVGSGQCVLWSPEVFDQDEDGLVLVLAPEPDPDLRADVNRAEDLCPARAVRVHD